MDLAPGESIGQYRIVQKIGEGGMGAVYKADQPSIPRAVVIKVLAASFAEFPDARDRFRRELDMITRLEHPHILPVYDFGEVNASPYIVMRFMTGGSLQERLQVGGLGRAEALRLLEQIAQALDFAHDRGIIHRDIKPANILLDESDNAYLADFGLAKTVSGTQDLTATGSTLGSPAYMSPEQARGERLDRQSDVYSFTVLAYRILSGRLPFEADTAWGFITKHISEPPVPIRSYMPDLPQAADDVLAAGLSKDPKARPARATALLANLKAALIPGTGATIISPAAPGAPRSAVARPAAPAWRIPAVLAGGAVALLIIGGLAAIVIYLASSNLRGARPTTYPVGDEPRALLFDGGSLWVANFFDNTVSQLAVSTCGSAPEGCGQTLRTVDVDDLPVAMVFDGSTLWVASSLEQTVAAVNPASGEVGPRYPLPHVPSALAWDGRSLWTANAFDGTVTQVSPDGQVLADIDVGAGPAGIVFDGTSVWVINQEGHSLVRIDPIAARVQETIALEGSPTALALDGTTLWIGLADIAQVIQFDLQEMATLQRLDLGTPPAALWFDGDQLWAAGPEAGNVYRIDPTSAEVVDTIALAGFRSSEPASATVHVHRRASMTETIPFDFPGYRVQGLIGRGGMGRVYRAEQIATRRPVAIKILTAGSVDPARLADFRREASTLAQLEHPHIVPLYDYGEREGSPYLVVRYFGGGTVADRLTAGPIAVDTALDWLDDVAAALDTAHRRGITHRDVKPSNLLLDEAGHIYLGDFGIAAAAIDLAAAPHSGSAAYASPEQARGETPDTRSDVYSLAVTAFEMLTGAKPYEAETALGMMVRHMHDPVPSARALAPALPAGLDAAIAAGMAKDPGDRPPSAGAFARSLRAGLSAPVPDRGARRAPSLGLLVGLAAVAAIACLAVVGLFGGGLAVYFVTSATTTPPPTPRVSLAETDVPTPPVVEVSLPFTDDFSDPASGFGVQEDTDGQVAYAGGGLQFTILTPGIEWFSPLQGLAQQDFSIEVNAQQLDGPPGSEMGVICRWQDEGNYVAAALRNDGMVSLWKKSAGVDDRWLDWTPIPGFGDEAGAARALRLTCDGTDIRFTVDGVEVAAATDAVPTSGSLALMAGLLEPGSLLVTFDQLDVRQP